MFVLWRYGFPFHNAARTIDLLYMFNLQGYCFPLHDAAYTIDLLYMYDTLCTLICYTGLNYSGTALRFVLIYCT